MDDYVFKPGGVVRESEPIWFDPSTERILPVSTIRTEPQCPYCDPEIPDAWQACPVHRDGNG